MKGEVEQGNGMWTTGETQETELKGMLGDKKWLVVVTKNTPKNRKIVKKCALEQFATDKKRHTLIAIHIPRGTEIGETKDWARIMEKVQKWKEGGKQLEIKPDNFRKTAGTISMQATDWKTHRKKEIEKALAWMDNVHKRNGIVTDKDIEKMRQAGISRRSAGKIAREVEDGLFQLYTEDIRLKRKLCKKKE